MKKRLTVAKTFKNIAKLRKSREELEKQLRVLGHINVRGKTLNNMDNNYILYNIAMFKTMMVEVIGMYPEGGKREKLMKDTLGENIEDQLKTMREYLRLDIKCQDIVNRIGKLENYMDHIPSEEKKAYKLEKAAENVDDRDLTDDA